MTIIGIFILFFIFVFFIRSLMKKDVLSILALCIFFVPFSGVSIYNIVDSSFYFLPFTLMALFWIVYHLVRLLGPNGVVSINLNNSYILLLLTFTVAISLSTLSPILINGSDGFMGSNEQSNIYYPIVPSTIYFLQFLYIFIGAIFSIFVIGFLKELYQIEFLIKIMLLSGLIACIVGLIELLSFYLGIDYLTWYHTVPTGDINDKGVRLDGFLGIARINSISYETVTFAQHMLIQYAVLHYCRSHNLIIFSEFKDKALSYIFIISLLLALSSTAIFGLIIIHSLIWMLTDWNIKKVIKLLVFLISVSFGIYALYSNIEIIAQVLDFFVFNKFSSGSFESRLSTGYSSFEVFIRNPLIGVGFGVLPPSDLIVVLLSGSGLLGFFIFSAMAGVAIYNGYINPKKIFMSSEKYKILNKDKYRILTITNALTFSFVILLIVYQASGFAFRFGDFWSLSALVVSSYVIRNKMIFSS